MLTRVLSAGHEISAREAYLRASNYYRVAEFLLMDPEDPRIKTTWESSKGCFGKAASLFSPSFEPVEIPYEGTTLPGYFYKVDNDSKSRRPSLIAHGGFDSTLEELYTSVVRSRVGTRLQLLDLRGSWSRWSNT